MLLSAMRTLNAMTCYILKGENYCIKNLNWMAQGYFEVMHTVMKVMLVDQEN